ncbi:hypothetical protein J1P26_19990 [Neobacillus sp. MM2021_6]|uniref:hypothetical protein n=1 Tax=Bacillaceae TaxID=186817 RepID=UPI00140B0955|nr:MULTISPECIES: hypothetical protein [Bacillaceae]MBO0961990.1 hypothetical protein [Neobacillus sp. MM2021_6]NHC20314.1 hypothetical protein [Bacillus sp. MM2020_4]
MRQVLLSGNKRLQVYKKYFETARDNTHLVMHRGYALALVKMIEELHQEYLTLSQSIVEEDTMIQQLQEENIQLKHKYFDADDQH